MMRVLVACEESQTVTKAFRALGHEAWSCDIQEQSGGHPEWHILGDAMEALHCQKWDMLLAFPPCTHLSSSGARWWAEKRADGRQQEAFEFFMDLAHTDVARVCLENPVGIVSTLWRASDQIIHPYQFGHEAQKRTCLWLKGLPRLVPTNVVGRGKMYTRKDGNQTAAWSALLPATKDRGKLRSKTFPGIAAAMAAQWGGPL